MNDDVNSFLQGGSGKAAKLEELGDAITGTVIHAEVQQQTSMEDNTPLTWSDGSPRKQLVITLATDLRDDGDDDGNRRLYAKGGNFEPQQGSGKSMKEAIAEALKKAQAKLEDGGTLTVALTGIGKKTNRGYNAPKLYKAKYEPPKAVSISESDLFDNEEPF